MNAVLVGCGKVGSELAKTLVDDGHNVSVIDIKPEPLAEIESELDVMTYQGNGADLEILKEAGIGTADIFIAVSTSDEMNILSCLMTKAVTQCDTVARVRNPLYSHEKKFFRNKLGLSMIINPEHRAADQIYNLLEHPSLTRVDFFEEKKIVVAMLKVRKEYRFTGLSLGEFMKDNPSLNARVCAVSRGTEDFIPDGSFVIEQGDELTIIASREGLKEFLRLGNVPNSTVDTIIIVGGGTISHYLVQRLLERGKKVRLIEKNDEICNHFSEFFPKAEVIRGDGTDRKFLMKEGLANADAFVPLTGMDEENLVIATYVKHATGAKVITKVTRTDMSDLIKTLEVDSVVFPKLLCADIIAQYARALEAGARGNVATLFRHLSSSLEIYEFQAMANSGCINRPLALLQLKKNLIIAAIIHDKEYEIPSGSSIIFEGDLVIVITAGERIARLSDILL